MSRARRRHDAEVKKARRLRLWAKIHPHADVGHRALYWPIRCRCDWCIDGKRRHLNVPEMNDE